MASRDLLSLSIEILSMIVEMLPDRTSMNNISRTCSHMHQIVLPILYQELTVLLDGDFHYFTRNMLQFGNPGIQSVRRLVLKCATAPVTAAMSKKIDWIVGRIIGTLPAQKLTHITIGAGCSLSLRNFQYLVETQPQVRVLSIATASGPYCNAENWIELAPPQTECLRELNVDFRRKATKFFCGFIAHILVGAPAISCLTISVSDAIHNHLRPGLGKMEDAIAALYLDPGTVRLLPRTLTTLKLHNINLIPAGELPRITSELSTLHVLSLQYCEGTVAFLQRAASSCGSDLRMSLQTLDCIFDQEFNRELSLIGVENFISLCGGLRRICFGCHGEDGYTDTLDIACLLVHSKTLEVLMLDLGETYDLQAVQSIVTSCTALRELGLALHEYDISYGTDVPNYYLRSEFLRFLEVLKSCPTLQTLAICRPPNMAQEESDQEWDFFDELRNELATDVFRLLAIELLLIGCRFNNYAIHPLEHSAHLPERTTLPGSEDVLVQSREMVFSDIPNLSLGFRTEIAEFYKEVHVTH